MANFGHFLALNFYKRCAKMLRYLVQLQRICKTHEYHTTDCETFWQFQSKFTVLRCDKFGLSFKNLIDVAFDVLQKSEHAHCFQEFLKKSTDINAARFHGQQNWIFGLPK